MGLAQLRKNNLDSILAKTKKVAKKPTTTRKSGGIYQGIKDICDLVEKKLGHLKEQQLCIQDEFTLVRYINHAVENGYISIDTETNGLDPICDDIVGACIYTPGEKPAYIPINHVSLITGVRLNNQLTNEQVSNAFKLLVDNNVKVIYFNAKFDIRVMRHQLGVNLKPYWDGYIASRCLKENEEEGNLKYLWTKYCSKDKTAEHFTFDKLFKGYKFSLFPIESACLYAANDAIITWELFKFQEPYLTEDDPKCIEAGLQKVAKLYHDIEMPIIEAVADIEDNGIGLDLNYIQELSVMYHNLLQEKVENFNKALEGYKDVIIQYKATHPATKLGDPINIGSSTQLAELFYDIFKMPVIDKKKPRGTGEEILEKMDHPLCKPILEYRGVAKLLNTYVDKMPNILNKKTNKVHCNFNQYGADTGRFSSSDPNLQNIPSHEKRIRRMFVASKSAIVESSNNLIEFFLFDYITTSTGKKFSQELVIGDSLVYNDKHVTITNIERVGTKLKIQLTEDIEIKVNRIYILIGSDFSQQEPKITADLSNDEQFIAQCASGKDAYAIIASITFEVPYAQCLEFYLDEYGKKTDKINKEGKERRSIAKVLLLGICYGKTMKSIAQDLGVSEQKAQEIYDAVLKNIPGLKKFMEDSEEMARVNGWVETKWGRRRHIPEMQLAPYEIQSIGTQNFDPFFDSAELGVIDDSERLKQQYLNEIMNVRWYKEKKAIKERAEKDGFHIHDNIRFIEDAKRQCVNSRIQGSAADQSKLAIQNLYKNNELKELGWKTLLLVHDEIIGECPLINAKRCGELLAKSMLDSAKDLRTGAACDATYVFAWYDDQFGKDIKVEHMSEQELEDLIVKCIKGDSNEL